ncbi:hypothetical protein KRR40_23250 [Niabella defluvii]|nr:hypothetical protein KRR40_23250 [Niabella sp. I65]
MKAPVYRFFAVEHLLGMIVAIALVHVGRSFAKKNIPDATNTVKPFCFT